VSPDALDTFLSGIRSDAGPTVIEVDAAVRSAAPLHSAIKWRQLLYGLDGDFHHWVCAIAVSKNRVTLNFYFGGLLPDSEGAFRVGTSKFMRMLDFDTPESVDAGLIGRRVRDALEQLEYFKANWKRIQAEG
jgi:hypothetical protein